MMGNRIKIFHIMTRLVVGGAQDTALSTCSYADRSRFDQALIVGPQTGPEGSLFDEAAKLGVKVIIVPPLVREISPLQDARAIEALIRLLHRERPDIVHTHSSKAGVLGRVAASVARIPHVVHSVHGWSFHDHMPGSLQQSIIMAERTMARITDRFIVENVSDRRKGIDNRIGRPEDYVTVRNGVRLELYEDRSSPACMMIAHSVRGELRIPLDATVVGTIIRLTTQKNPAGFVRAAAVVLKDLPDCYFVIVGDGPLRNATETLARDLGIDHQLRFTGVRRDVPRLLAAFDVFALSSRWEGLPRVVLEAMASGVPIVAPRVDGVGEAVEDGVSGVLVTPDDSYQLAHGILQLIEDPEVSHRYQIAARKTVDGLFSAERMTDQLEHLYQSLAGPAR